MPKPVLGRGPSYPADQRSMTRRSRLGVFGGTFDPIHVGHLVAAINVRHALALDRLLLVVANDPWQKTDRRITPAADRLAMVEAAVGGVDGLEACDIEVRRGGPSYTAETLAELAAREPGVELHLVVGSDAAGGLDTWQRPEVVQALAHLVVVVRPGTEATEPPHGWRHTVVEIPRLDVSSTDLRRRVADGRPLDWLVPPEVARVMRERRLYSAGR